MDHFHLTIAGAALLIGTSASATLPIAKNDGCLDGPMAQFGQYLGNWHIADSQLATDGSAWTDGWKWKMEQSTDEGQSWREVYRIVATPWKEKPPES